MKLPVAVLGATGPVGQKVISMLENHPNFFVAELAASEARVGKPYGEIVSWKNEFPLSERIAKMEMIAPLLVKSRLVISALPTDAAREVEPALASKGAIVSSNASAFRMQSDIPLLIPEVNISHLDLLARQTSSGRLMTNPNCSTVFLACALAPLMELGSFAHVSVVTMQALSGAGYPGVSAFDLLGNLIPHIGGEEAKIQEEVKKILGSVDAPATFPVTVHVHRVPVLHGHTIVAHVRFKEPVSVEKVNSQFRKWSESMPGLFELHTAQDRPQPLRDITPHDMRVHIGRVKQGEDPYTVGFISMGHNLIRGAAGAAIANLETALRFMGELK